MTALPADPVNTYRDYLRRQVAKVRLFGTDREYDLTKVFVELTVTTHDRPSRSPDLSFVDRHLRSLRDPFFDNDNPRVEERSPKEPPRQVRPEELLRPGNHAVVTGAPGSGKSTLLRYLAARALDQPDRFSVYLELKSAHALAAAPDLAAAVFDHAVSGLSLTKRPRTKLGDSFSDALAGGRAALFLDGLDEATNPDAVCQLLDAFRTSDYRHSAVILSSRPHALHRTRLPGFDELEIAPLTDRQVRDFLRHYYPGDPAVQTLLAQLNTNSAWRDLARVPVLLATVFELSKQQSIDALTRLDICREIVDRLVRRIDQEKHVGRKFVVPDPEGTIKTGFLERLAGRRLLEPESVDANRFIFPADYIQRAAQAYLPAASFQLAADVKATALLREVADGVYAFSHLTLQEYLAARYLATQPDAPRLLCRYAFDPLLSAGETLPMALGLLPDPNPAYETLASLPDSLAFALLRLRCRGLAYVQK